MNPVENKIIQRIKNEGPITFEAFMDMALYDSETGYYSSAFQRIGREGDFYTSSHLHPLFGAVICRQISGMWVIMGRPGEFTVVEMGAGEGHLCRDILDYAESADKSFYKALRYVIVERNDGQRQRQQERLSSLTEKISWIRKVSEAGEIRGCIFSNELLDAFPVHIVKKEDLLREIYVSHDGIKFVENAGILSTGEISDYFRAFNIELGSGYTTEVNLNIKRWLRDVSTVLKEGFLFTIDYGYPAEELYSEDRNRGTLICYYRHQISEDPYEHVGEQDMTSHINFSSLKVWGEELGLKTSGYCSQGTFLLSSGIDEEIERLSKTSKDYLFELARIKKLFLPQGLGESHKVMIQYKGIEAPKLRGFSIRNQMRFL